MMIGFLADLIFGDPRWLYHPVRLIGKEISFLEKKLRAIFPKTQKGEFQAGIWMAVIICISWTLIPLGLVGLGYRIHLVFGILLESFLCYQMLATRSLKDESMRVYRELKKGDLPGARNAVSMIVGRDTENLTE